MREKAVIIEYVEVFGYSVSNLKKSTTSSRINPMLSQNLPEKAGRLAATMPTINESEIHTNGMTEIVH
jgi:hypothetical protein